MDTVHQWRSFRVQIPCALGLEAKQFAHVCGDDAARQILGRAAESRQIFLGQIDAAERQIAPDITQDIGQY